MTVENIIADLKARKFKPIYLLQGDEPYFIDQIVDFMENNILSDMERGFNQTVLYGKDTDMSAVLNAAKRFPMMSDYQLVVVKEAQDLDWPKGDRENAYLINYFEKPQPSTILVFAYKQGSIDKRKKLFKAISNSGVVFQSDPVRDYKIVAWIQDFLQSKGYKIAPAALNLLAEYLGTDLSKIVNELEKLFLNIDKSVIIDTDLIQRNIGISKDYNVFELQKALATRNVLKSNQIINYFAENPKSNPLVMVMANLYGYFSKILKYHYLTNKADAAKELGVCPFFVKDYESASRTFSLAKTYQIISYLREYDLKSKGLDSTGNTEDGELMKELVFKILH
jgi:DNA polymerase-3 subunit delta